MSTAINPTDLVFQALASQPRRQIIDLVIQSPGCSVNDLCEHFEFSRIAVMKHLKVLVEARLILSRKQGRTRQLFFNAVPIQMVYDRWTSEFSRFWVTQAVDLKYKVEGKSRAKKATKKSPARSKQARGKSATRTSIATVKKPAKRKGKRK
ncbi:MAG: ArsR family transcriptional regulator [Pirellulaceae bacterium]